LDDQEDATVRINGFRSADLRQVVRAAVDQDWELVNGGKHPALVCPVCGHQEIVTKSGCQRQHEFKSKIGRLRKHGFVWKGQGGNHSAQTDTG
jgi:predicted RNA-binding Zn-ribbon protein involved in translation (DUF1610 family)